MYQSMDGKRNALVVAVSSPHLCVSCSNWHKMKFLVPPESHPTTGLGAGFFCGCGSGYGIGLGFGLGFRKLVFWWRKLLLVVL